MEKILSIIGAAIVLVIVAGVLVILNNDYSWVEADFLDTANETIQEVIDFVKTLK